MSHSAGDSKTIIRTTASLCALALACAALSVSGCADDREVGNQDARIVLVGGLSNADDRCDFRTTTSQALSEDVLEADSGEVDAGEPGDAGDSLDAGASDAGADAGDDAGNDEPTQSGRAELERDGDSLAIPYLIIDREGDTQSIKVEICGWDGSAATDCGVAIAGIGGGGASGISTTPGGQCVLHVFNWNVGCGRFTGVDGEGAKPVRTTVGVDDEIIARISVNGSKETPGQSAPFNLKALGFDALPNCE
ncbi:hypothetical protein [Bradymonas sediminis]|uniref:Uncharacterized protein n=1 Tax=Bradymonas sediminis TaxID=1548548 RepID=A0A2Z4FJP7_9DELT|nr:hypothetical protein [Bradymonas sediminis]AWV89142.1 hypothetical protein DN745_07245 [Bradymonas sediminis]TDP64392.1 hypothetical protein DFR33_10953 [Bradymonas sediminis]